MKLSEFRELLKKADKGQLEKITAEIYKLLSKDKKEDADGIMNSVLLGEDLRIKNKKVAVVDFNVLENQVERFIENAYASNYFAPNRVIPKRERPKWRFLVKSFIKELEKITLDDPNFINSTILLKELYEVLCKGCCVYLFSTDDTFNSVGISQESLCDMIVGRFLSSTVNRDTIKSLLIMVTDRGVASDTYHLSLEFLLINKLRTEEMRNYAIEELKVLIKETEEKLKCLPARDQRKYALQEKISNFCEMYLMVQHSSEKNKECVLFFMEHYRAYNEEGKISEALHIMEMMEDDPLWLWIYEYAVKKRIKLNERAKVIYHKLRAA